MSAKKYTWDLTDLYRTVEEWEKDLEKIQELTGTLAGMQGQIVSSARQLYRALQTRDRLFIVLSRAYSYARMAFDTDMSGEEARKRYERIDTLASTVQNRLAFLEPELLQMTPEQFNSYCGEILELSDYTHNMEKLFRQQEHVLDSNAEQILSRMSSLGNSFKKVFDDITVNDLDFPEIETGDGDKIIAGEAAYRKCLNSRDRDLRKRYFYALLSTYKSHLNSLTSTYYGAVKHDVFTAATRNYSSSREMALSGDFIPLEVYDNLVHTVREKAAILHDYIALRKKALNLDQIHFYDLFVPLVEKGGTAYSFEGARDLVLEALSILGEDYIQKLRRAFEENWIDVYPRPGKKSGAYALGIYGSHPYSLQNFTETLDDVFTLAHEMGHAMHSYYSNENQPFATAQYTIFTAEVASTVNETLLYHYLLSRESSPQNRAYLLSMHLDSLRSTLFRQTLFADFEMQAHQAVEEETPLTPGMLSSLYHSLYRVYYGKDFTIDEELNYEWLRIPHFYRSFYVYQYATGVSAAISIAGKIMRHEKPGENPALDGYLEFLKSGGSDYSINLLKKAGVDMTSPQPLLDALHDFDRARQELEEILL